MHLEFFRGQKRKQICDTQVCSVMVIVKWQPCNVFSLFGKSFLFVGEPVKGSPDMLNCFVRATIPFLVLLASF